MDSFRFAVCNELFGSIDARTYIPIVKRSGYDGIEFAPYTVFADFNTHQVKKRAAEIHELLKSEGLAFSGFHWLLAYPDGMHLLSNNKYARGKAWDHLKLLFELSYEFGGGALVLGSPRQRMIPDNMDRNTAIRQFINEIGFFIESIEGSKSLLLIEALSPDQTNFINTLHEAVELVKQIDSPYFQTMFDFHNARDEKQPWDKLIEENFEYIKHIHINEINGDAPGTGKSDYRKAFSAIKTLGYDRWISMEIFTTPSDPERCIKAALEFQKMNFRLI